MRKSDWALGLEAIETCRALCESLEVDAKTSSADKFNNIRESAGEESDGDDVMSVDDMYDTVDVPHEESPSAPAFDADAIELSEEEKESAKNAIIEILNSLGSDSISEPALEMIVNEVANDSAYLTEAESAELDGPVEKESFRTGKVEAFKKFFNQLFGKAEENGGTLPEDLDLNNLEGGSIEGGAEGGDNLEPISDEGAGAGPVGGDGDGDNDDVNPLTEGQFPGSADETKPEGGTDADVVVEGAIGAGNTEPLNESPCFECGEDGIVEVDPIDTIQVVDDNDPNVTALDGLGGMGGDLGAGLPPEAGVLGGDGDADDDSKAVTVGDMKRILGAYLAEGVEGFETKTLDQLFKSISTQATQPKFTPKGVQKTVAPASASDVPVKSSIPAEDGNSVVLPKVTPKGFQQTKSPTANLKSEVSLTVKDSIPNQATPDAGKVPAAKTADTETKNLTASVFTESASGNAKTFLAEAKGAIAKYRESKKS